MTQEGFERACHALMAARTAAGDKCYFPKVYVSQDSPSFTKAAANYYNKQQHNLYGKPFTEIEEVTFEQAWKHTHNGEDAPANELKKVCGNIDSLVIYGHSNFQYISDEQKRKNAECYQRNKEKYLETRRQKRLEERGLRNKEKGNKKVKPNKK